MLRTRPATHSNSFGRGINASVRGSNSSKRGNSTGHVSRVLDNGDSTTGNLPSSDDMRSDSMRSASRITTPNPGIGRSPTVPAPPLQIGRSQTMPPPPLQKRPHEMDEGDEVGKKGRSDYWYYRDDCELGKDSGLLWANTTRRPTNVSSPAHEMVLRHAKQVLLAQIFSGGGPKLDDGRMC